MDSGKKAERALTLFLETVEISLNMVNTTSYNDVDGVTFVACVLDLEKKYWYMNAYSSSSAARL